jgi:hypothetical protein
MLTGYWSRDVFLASTLALLWSVAISNVFGGRVNALWHLGRAPNVNLTAGNGVGLFDKLVVVHIVEKIQLLLWDLNVRCCCCIAFRVWWLQLTPSSSFRRMFWCFRPRSGRYGEETYLACVGNRITISVLSQLSRLRKDARSCPIEDFAKKSNRRCPDILRHSSLFIQVKFVVTVKLALYAPRRHVGVKIKIHSFLASARGEGEWATSRPGGFTPGKDRRCVGFRAGLDGFLRKKYLLPLPRFEPRTFQPRASYDSELMFQIVWRRFILHPSSLSSGLLPSGFRTKTLYVPLLSPVCATYSVHLSLRDLITRNIQNINLLIT